LLVGAIEGPLEREGVGELIVELLAFGVELPALVEDPELGAFS
jgi:hypothetical protein